MKINKQTVEQRTKRLESARVYLKSQFVGIDSIIDKFIDSVKIWYILPDVQTRPLIVNLWGITGCGKTDLVRKFVSFLEMNEKFCEIQMDSREGHAEIQDYLDNTFETDEQGILLLDEIQRFRTIKEDGTENNSSKFQDLWMLLSDGVLQSNSRVKQELIRIVVEDEYREEYDRFQQSQKTESDTPKKNDSVFKYRMYYYEAARFKKLLRLSESIEEIMKYTKDQKLKIINDKTQSKEVYGGRKYSKLLIIISGNLDEAFQVASNVDDADMDADVYHEYSKTIDIIKIKKALTKRFKPEQISRFGNIHMIYPILNKASYYNIIKQKVQNILDYIKEANKINITVDDSVYNIIYQNGVFPAQGVRPLMSTISAIIENSLPYFIFEHLKTGTKKTVKVSYVNGNLVSKINNKTICYAIPRVLDEIKELQTINKRTLIAVHEAGHAVAYALLYKTAPTQIVSNTTSVDASGFVGVHTTLKSKMDILNHTIVGLSGRVAEELIFGEEYITSGASTDYCNATEEISRYVRQYGMDDFNGIYIPSAANKVFLDSPSKVDEKVELILKKMYQEAKHLLKENMDYLIQVSQALVENIKLTPEEFADISRKFVSSIKIVNPKNKLEVDYNSLFKKAVDKNKVKKVFTNNSEVPKRKKKHVI